MNIWWVNQVALPPTEPGVTRHYSFARALGDAGHQATIVLSNFHYIRRVRIRDLAGRSSLLEDIEGVRFAWIRTPGYGDGYAARVRSWVVFAWRVWRGRGLRAEARPDVIIGSSPYPFAAFGAYLLARRCQVPFVLEIRDIWPQTLVELGGISPGHPFVRVLAWIEKHLYRKADAIITLLAGASDHMVERGATRDKIVWIPNGTDFRLLEETPPPDGEPPFTVLYAGGHGLPNDLDDVLDAAAILLEEERGREPAIRIRLMGDGPEKKRLQRRAAEEGLSNVDFAPSVPKARVYRELLAADAFVVVLRDSPLYRHGASLNKFFDYMACGRPTIIASGLEANPFVESGSGVAVPSGSPPLLAGAIRRLAHTPLEARREMGRRGREYVAANHDIRKLAERLVATLDPLLG